MQVTELLKLTDWFKTNVEDAKVRTNYLNLFNQMNSNINAQRATPFTNKKDILVSSIENINFQSLSLEQIKFLDKLGVSDLLGKKGVENIEKILSDNNLDIVTATEKIGQLLQKIQQASGIINELSIILNKSFSIEQDSEIEKNNVLIRVYFKENAAINNLTNFKEYGNIWYGIGRGISMAQNQTPEDFKIIGADKGSVIMVMAAAYALARTLSTILLEGLKVTERILDIRKKGEEIKALKLSNEVQQAMKNEAEKAKIDGVKNILDIVIRELDIKQKEQGDKISALEKSIKDLIEFTEKGGVVDFAQTQETENIDENVRKAAIKLNANIIEIRAIESKMKLIEQ